MKNKIYVLCILLTFIICSCEKNSTETKEKQLTDYYLKDGVLVFKNQTSFDKIFNYLINKDEMFLNKWNDSLKFLPYRLTHSIDTLEKEISIFDRSFNPIDLPHLSSILNSDGAFVISNTLHKFQDGKEITIDLNKMTSGLSLSSIIKNIDSFQEKNELQITVKSLKPEMNSNIKTNSVTLVEDYVQNINCSGRPERIFYQSGIITSNSFIQCVVHLYGQAYRKGGVFGSKSWRSDEFAYAGLDIAYRFSVYNNFNQYVNGGGRPYGGFYYKSYNTDERTLYTPNFYSYLGRNQHFEDVYVDSKFEVQKNSCAPIETYFR